MLRFVTIGTRPNKAEDQNAKRTARAEAPSGRYRQCSSHCKDSDRRRTGNNIEATGEAQKRPGRSKGAYAEYNTRGPQSDCREGSSGTVGMMPFDFSSDAWTHSDYRYAVTIDPNEAADAWQKLSQNEWAVEFGNLPKILHSALLKTLVERRKALIEK